jgi:hypothetical protein
VLPTLGVTPYGAVQFQDFHTSAYSESQSDLISGGFGLAVNAMNATDVRTELGSRFDAPTLVYGKPLVFYGRVAWAHDFVDNPALSAGFQTLQGTNFTVLVRQSRLGAYHGRCKTVPCRQLVIDRQVRRRVCLRRADLCRLGHAALYVVSGRDLGWTLTTCRQDRFRRARSGSRRAMGGARFELGRPEVAVGCYPQSSGSGAKGYDAGWRSGDRLGDKRSNG